MSLLELPDERGPAKYFHGRREILDSFEYQLETAVRKRKSGTIFLIQGPPGSGKTALLDHCRKLAALSGWQTVKIGPASIGDTNNMRTRLGRKWYEAVQGIRIGGDTLSIPATLLSVNFNKKATTPLSMIQGGKDPLLLFMDEAQLLGDRDIFQSKERRDAIDFLEEVHNGSLKRPVILLAAGLGMTRESFKHLGVSRYEAGCFTEMGALNKESERDLITNWMVLEARVPLRHVGPWVDAITQETHGWPQHITSYLIPTLTEIHKAGGELTEDGLAVALEAGHNRKIKYYNARAEGLEDYERTSFARIFAEASPDGKLDKRVILQKLSAEYGAQKAEELVRTALADGVLYRKSGIYRVPIPSMSDWFLDNYLPENELQ